MKSFVSAFVLLASAITSVLAATPSLYLVGDSTMASHKTSEGIQGWGVYAPQYFGNITIVNRAVSGRSARSYTREGRWAQIKALLKPGDYVVVEFGHNDGGSPSTSDRAPVGGEGTNTQTVTLTNGTVEVVQTWSTYVRRMIADAKEKQATIIISSQSPNNPYENSQTIINSPPRFVGYAKNVATAAGVPYVDHFAATISYYTKLGKATVEGYFPFEHTHTNEAGANAVAWSFLSGLRCPAAKGALQNYVNAKGQGAGARC